MQQPRFSQLRARVPAPIASSIVILLVLLTFLPTCIAYAVEAEATLDQDHNHHRIQIDASDIDWGAGSSLNTKEGLEGWDGQSAAYQSDFSTWGPGGDRSIIGRAAEDTTALRNKVPTNINIDSGQTINYVFEKTDIFSSDATPTNLGLLNGIAGSVRTKQKRSEDQELLMDGEESSVNVSLGGRDGQEGFQEAQELVARQASDTRVVYISINTCLQPRNNGSTSDAMPQLSLYVSTSETKPGPTKGNTQQQVIPLLQGFAKATITTTGNVYIAVAAPSISRTSLTGGWNYEIVVSTSGHASYFRDDKPFLWTIDTDSTSALLATYNLTQVDPPRTPEEAEMLEDLREQWTNASNPFSLFVYNATDPKIEGIRNSYCGLSKINSGVNVTTGMTRRGFGGNPKQQFYVDNLQSGQNYIATLAYSAPNISQVWLPLSFATKVDGNCKIIYDLPFCSSIAYAVPHNNTNPSQDLAMLKQTYDSFAASMYKNFTNSLDQVACNASSTAQYSLVRNCDDCARDYKTWLCAVTIPRCADFSTPNTPEFDFLVPRAIASTFPNGTKPDLNAIGLNQSMTDILRYNSSRSPIIDSDILPGPYKEVLPCRDLCYDLVRSCPASLGFSCPVQEALWKRSYGELDRSKLVNGELTCNYPGVDWPDISAGVRVADIRLGLALLVVAATTLTVI